MHPKTFTKLAASWQLLFSGLLGVWTACDEAATSSLPPKLRSDLQGILDNAVANEVTPGLALHVVGGDGETWSAAAGLADLERNAPLGPEERFRAGSVLKTFVATAVLQVVEAGALDLRDVLTTRLPAAVTARIPNAASIELGMLLGHRSGIPEWVTAEVEQAVVADPEHVWSLNEILDLIASQSSAFQPGSQYGYSNSNYILLGEILSEVTGRSWREIVRDQVLARAGLEHTSLPDPGDPECPEPCARGYLAIDGELVDVTRVDPSMAGASGGHALITTLADLTRCLQLLRDGALFDLPNTGEAMFTFQSAIDTESRLVGYGLGVMQLESNGNVAVGHLGGTAGYQSFVLYVAATDRYMSGFINVQGDLAAVLEPVLKRVARP